MMKFGGTIITHTESETMLNKKILGQECAQNIREKARREVGEGEQDVSLSR